MKRCVLVCGLGFGDEGKGSIVDFLVQHHNAELVVRCSGGPQAGHTVVMQDGRRHVFSQFGSGTFRGAKTYLSAPMVVDPLAMMAESKHLQSLGIADPFSLVSVDPECLIVTPYHQALNRLRELFRGDMRHGSCGMGVHECRKFAEEHPEESLHAGDLTGSFECWEFGRKLHVIRRYCHEMASELADGGSTTPDEVASLLEYQVDHLAKEYCDWNGKCRRGDPEEFGTAIFEGSQGVLLDQDVGFWPHVTHSRVTFTAAHPVMSKLGIDEYSTVGATRCYHTRHGAGPMPPEVKTNLTDDTNVEHPWQGKLRYAFLDRELLIYSSAMCGDKLDLVAVTHLDKPLEKALKEGDILSFVLDATRSHNALLSFGPTAEDKRFDWLIGPRKTWPWRQFNGHSKAEVAGA